VLSDEVDDVLPEDAGDDIGSTLVRQWSPRLAVSLDVPANQGLKELDLASSLRVARLSLDGQGGADGLDVSPVDDVLDGDAVVVPRGLWRSLARRAADGVEPVE
jgi:hypothetical protein